MTKTSVPVGRRELERAHIAFYRAVMDGVDARRAWDQYLHVDGDFTDALCTATLGWVRQALIREAVAAGQPGLIGLFRRDPRQVRGSPKPTLTEFASRFDDAGDFSEAELSEMWREEYGGPDRAEARRERLGRRLREALQLLEKATRRMPAPIDPVAQWLAPNVAERLMAAGLTTLGDAAAALQARKTPRWEEVPGVGEIWADRLSKWIAEHHIKPPRQTTLPAPARSSVLVPLEQFQMPRDQVLPAAATAAPAKATHWPYPNNNSLGASDDHHAIKIWLASKATNPNTLRAYRKNAERLLLWCYYERRTTFPELKVEDCIHYREWLKTLGKGHKDPAAWAAAGWRIPAAEWIGKRAARRGSPEWRPFDKGLSAESVAQDLLTVRSLFAFLKSGRILSDNPWDLLPSPAKTRANLDTAKEQFTERSLSLEQWQVATAGLSLQGGELERRLLVILWLGFACGLRAAEMLSLTLGSLDPRQKVWRLKVLGKGGRTRIVPLPSPARDAVLAYLDAVGVPYDLVLHVASMSSKDNDEARASLNAPGPKDAPLLRSRDGRRKADPGPEDVPTRPLRYTRLYESLKSHLASCADRLDGVDPVGANRFRVASTHWLRHTCATLAIQGGVQLPAVQKLLGHSSLTTTSTYVTKPDEELANDMESFVTGTMQGG